MAATNKIVMAADKLPTMVSLRSISATTVEISRPADTAPTIADWMIRVLHSSAFDRDEGLRCAALSSMATLSGIFCALGGRSIYSASTRF